MLTNFVNRFILCTYRRIKVNNFKMNLKSLMATALCLCILGSSFYGAYGINKDVKQPFSIKKQVLIKYNGDKKHVVIPKNVTVIGKMAFYKSPKLKSVIISKDVKEIKALAFANCKMLRKVRILNPDIKIAKSAFKGCFIKAIEIPFKNLENIMDNKENIDKKDSKKEEKKDVINPVTPSTPSNPIVGPTPKPNPEPVSPGPIPGPVNPTPNPEQPKPTPNPVNPTPEPETPQEVKDPAFAEDSNKYTYDQNPVLRIENWLAKYEVTRISAMKNGYFHRNLTEEDYSLDKEKGTLTIDTDKVFASPSKDFLKENKLTLYVELNNNNDQVINTVITYIPKPAVEFSGKWDIEIMDDPDNYYPIEVDGKNYYLIPYGEYSNIKIKLTGENLTKKYADENLIIEMQSGKKQRFEITKSQEFGKWRTENKGEYIRLNVPTDQMHIEKKSGDYKPLTTVFVTLNGVTKEVKCVISPF